MGSTAQPPLEKEDPKPQWETLREEEPSQVEMDNKCPPPCATNNVAHLVMLRLLLVILIVILSAASVFLMGWGPARFGAWVLGVWPKHKGVWPLIWLAGLAALFVSLVVLTVVVSLLYLLLASLFVGLHWIFRPCCPSWTINSHVLFCDLEDPVTSKTPSPSSSSSKVDLETEISLPIN